MSTARVIFTAKTSFDVMVGIGRSDVLYMVA